MYFSSRLFSRQFQQPILKVKVTLQMNYGPVPILNHLH